MRVAAVAAIVLFVSGSAGVSERDVYPSTRQDGTRLAGSLSPRSETRRCPDHRAGVQFYRQRHALWLKKRGAARPRSGRLPRSCPDARYLAIVWRTRARAARVMYRHHLARLRWERRQLYEKWRCIHEHEGAWNANTGNGYFGGLQMDLIFQRIYGSEFLRRWGTADRWPVWAQLETAERAYQSGRGFGPWPNTARMCGLL